MFALNLVTGLGLGLAIDYSLFMVSRYREEVAEHGAGTTALIRTVTTAGRTVLFSSLTVAAPRWRRCSSSPRSSSTRWASAARWWRCSPRPSRWWCCPPCSRCSGERVNSLSPKRLRRAAEQDARHEAGGSGTGCRAS